MSAELPRTLKSATIWLLLGASLFVGLQWWQHEAAKTRFTAQGGVIEIRRGDDGHYHWPGTLNGRDVDFLVDTGATGVAIPMGLARELVLGRLPWQQRDGTLRIDLRADASAGTSPRQR